MPIRIRIRLSILMLSKILILPQVLLMLENIIAFYFYLKHYRLILFNLSRQCHSCNNFQYFGQYEIADPTGSGSAAIICTFLLIENRSLNPVVLTLLRNRWGFDKK
jgi:hypothetical protein